MYGDNSFSEGSTICVDGQSLICENGQWNPNGPCGDDQVRAKPAVGYALTANTVQNLQFIPGGDGIYPIIVNKSANCLQGMLVIDGRVEWVPVQGYGTAKLPTHDYKRIDLVAEKACGH
jgi:hypothetical protein